MGYRIANRLFSLLTHEDGTPVWGVRVVEYESSGTTAVQFSDDSSILLAANGDVDLTVEDSVAEYVLDAVRDGIVSLPSERELDALWDEGDSWRRSLVDRARNGDLKSRIECAYELQD
jgi:hypothetical protein